MAGNVTGVIILKYFIILTLVLFGTGLWFYNRNQEGLEHQIGNIDYDSELNEKKGHSFQKNTKNLSKLNTVKRQNVPQVYDASNIAPLPGEQSNTMDEYIPNDYPADDSEVAAMDVGPSEIYTTDENVSIPDDEVNRAPANE
jgi:hypothetical protein